MKANQKFNIETTAKAAAILTLTIPGVAGLRGAREYAQREQAANLAVSIYEKFSPDYECAEDTAQAEANAISVLEKYSELVQDLYYIGEMLYEEGIYEKGYARIHESFGQPAYDALMAHIAQG
jgi:hypothetical protein